MKKQRKKVEENLSVRGGSFLKLGLYAFAGLGMEAVYAYLLEPLLYGKTMESWGSGQIIIHWIITCITWGIVAFGLIRTAKEQYHFDLLKRGEALQLWRWGLCLLFILLSFVVNYMDWGGGKVYLEFAGKGSLLFAFQYLYYAFETMLFLLIIVFGQRACEVWFRREGIPYGGIICGLTWGLAHIFTKDLVTGIECMVLGLALGSVFLLVNRDLRKAYAVLFFMFVL